MIHTSIPLNSREWLFEIEKASYYFSEHGPQAGNILNLELTDIDGSEKRLDLWLDEDGVVRHLERATGDFEESREIIGKRVVVVFDRYGDVVTFHKPFSETLAIA